jgi:CubicO group peptidase (beta-lactamase class C family)
MFSYCNAGFVVAGRLIERLRGAPWHRVLLDRLIHPAGLRPMGTEPEEAILGRAAVGHMPHPESGETFVIPIWRLTRSNAPAGATPFAAARCLLTFARLYLDGGRTADGTSLISESSVQLVQEHQMDVPPGVGADAWGLGWMLFDWGGKRVIGHDGATVGQYAFFRVLPEQRLAVALLTNGSDAPALYRALFNEIFEELAGFGLPPLPEADPQLELDLSLYTGSYRRISTAVEVRVEEGGLKATSTGLRPPMNMLPPQQMKLRPVDPGLFLADVPGAKHPLLVRFLDFDQAGRPRYLHSGGRAAPRVS